MIRNACIAAFWMMFVIGCWNVSSWGVDAVNERMAGSPWWRLAVVAPTPTLAPYITLRVMEPGFLICPDDTQIFTSTEGVSGGFKVSCW